MSLANTIRKTLSRVLASHDRRGRFFKFYAKAFRERLDIENNIAELLEGRAMFEDTFSQEQYEREVYFLLLSAMPELSPCSPLQWRTACAQALEEMEKGTLPRLSCYKQEELAALLATTFILKQYEYAPHVAITKEDIFLDAGGYVGDTACWAATCGAARVYSFEPLQSSQAHIEANKKICRADAIEIVPFGLSDHKGTASFHRGAHPAASEIVSEKDSQHKNIETINITTIDDWVEETGVNPTFIKMDIEGMEKSALRGAEKTITRLSPKLAICLYHNREDMLLIPRLIKEINPAYKLWCKKAHPRHEFILFAAV